MIKTDETHFNEMQMKVRALASTWMFGGFGAIAYFVKTEKESLELFSAFAMINLVSFMVVLGLFVLWVLDQVIYQRLLNASFVAGLYEEYKNHDTPPIRLLMIAGSEFKGMGRWYNFFYFIPMFLFTIFSAGSLLLEQAGDGTTKPPSTEIGCILIVISAFTWMYVIYTNRQIPYLKLLDSFGDPEFKKVCSKPEKCYEYIRKWNPEKTNEVKNEEG